MNIRFPILYVLPIGLAGFGGESLAAYILAATLPAVRFGFHFLWQDNESLHIDLINVLILISSLCLYVYLIDKIVKHSQGLEMKVEVLEGVLPICASCKRIRNDKGEYEQIEHYIRTHSGASFTHGICPECAKALYPECYMDDSILRRKQGNGADGCR